MHLPTLLLGLAVPLLAKAVPLAAPSDFAQIHLLQNDSVQKELKLTEPQARKLLEIFIRNRESTRDVWQKYPPEEAGTHWQELSQQLRTDALAVLTEAQRQRFWQVDFQNTRNMGFDSTTFQRADLAAKIRLTDEQKQKLRAIQAETLRKNQTASRSPQTYPQKLAAIRKEDREQVAALLTAEQKKKWDELIGPAFTVVHARRNGDLQAALRKWIRDDFPRAQAESRRTGKPIFTLFRCEP